MILTCAKVQLALPRRGEVQWSLYGSCTLINSVQGDDSLLLRHRSRTYTSKHIRRRTPILLADQMQWGPLAQGSLARPADQAGKTSRSEGKPGPAEVDAAIISRVQELAEKKGWPMSHVALAWSNKRISSPIIGFSSVKRMDEAIEANGKELSEEEEKYLEELYQPKQVMGFDTTLKRV